MPFFISFFTIFPTNGKNELRARSIPSRFWENVSRGIEFSISPGHKIVFVHCFRSSRCRKQIMFFRHIAIFSLIGVWLILFVNSFPQDPDDVFDSISSVPDCVPDPHSQLIKKRDTTGSPDDSTIQNSMDQGFPLGLKNSHSQFPRFY